MVLIKFVQLVSGVTIRLLGLLYETFAMHTCTKCITCILFVCVCVCVCVRGRETETERLKVVICVVYESMTVFMSCV